MWNSAADGLAIRFRLSAVDPYGRAAARDRRIALVRISGDIIRLEGDRTKNGLPHTIPLSAPALAVIEGLHRMPGDLVFTTTGKTPISGWSKAKYKLDETVAQLNGSPLKPWHVHDFRRTIATGMQKLGVEERVIDAVLGHINGGLRRVYQVTPSILKSVKLSTCGVRMSWGWFRIDRCGNGRSDAAGTPT